MKRLLFILGTLVVSFCVHAANVPMMPPSEEAAPTVETTTEAPPEAKTEAKIEVKTETKSEAKTETETKTDGTADSKAVTDGKVAIPSEARIVAEEKKEKIPVKAGGAIV